LNLQYSVIGNADTGIFAYTSGGTYSVAHDVFSNCNEAICDFATGFAAMNLTFSGGWWGFWGYSSANLSQCVFQGLSGEAVMSSDSNTALTITASNFSGNVVDLEIFGTGSSSNPVSNNTIAASGCFPATLNTQVYGTSNIDCSITVTAGLSLAVSSAGAGFTAPASASISTSVGGSRSLQMPIAAADRDATNLRNLERAHR
jgi:hypothetical protein